MSSNADLATERCTRALILLAAKRTREIPLRWQSSGGTFEILLKQHGVTHFELDQESRGLLSIASRLVRLNRILRRFKPDIIHVHMMTGAVYGTIGGWIFGTVGVRKREPAALAHPSVATLCGLHGRKGVHVLIDAFGRVAVTVSDAHLYIIGDGLDKDKLRNRAAELACRNRIEFLGQLFDPWPQLLATDIFVLASYADPGPLVASPGADFGVRAGLMFGAITDIAAFGTKRGSVGRATENMSKRSRLRAYHAGISASGRDGERENPVPRPSL